MTYTLAPAGSPAIGIAKCSQCGQEMHPTDYYVRLRDELNEARAQSTEDHAVMLAALGERMRLRQVNAELLAILLEWRATELDTMDEEWQPWMDVFTAKVDAAIASATKETT